MNKIKLLFLAAGLMAGITNFAECCDDISKRPTHEPLLFDFTEEDAFIHNLRTEIITNATEFNAQANVCRYYFNALNLSTRTTPLTQGDIEFYDQCKKVLHGDHELWNWKISTIEEGIRLMRRSNEISTQNYGNLKDLINQCTRDLDSLYEEVLQMALESMNKYRYHFCKLK